VAAPYLPTVDVPHQSGHSLVVALRIDEALDEPHPLAPDELGMEKSTRQGNAIDVDGAGKNESFRKATLALGMEPHGIHFHGLTRRKGLRIALKKDRLLQPDIMVPITKTASARLTERVGNLPKKFGMADRVAIIAVGVGREPATVQGLTHLLLEGGRAFVQTQDPNRQYGQDGQRCKGESSQHAVPAFSTKLGKAGNNEEKAG
jgi:hypothetical protein